MDSEKHDSNNRKVPGKVGLFRRFLNWIARGAEKSQMGSGQCRT